VEPEPPLKPEEEEILKAILKSPPRVKSMPKQCSKGTANRGSKATTEDELSEEDEMNIDHEDPDQEEEEEVAREVVDIGSDMEADSDEERPSKTSSRAQPQPQPQSQSNRRENKREAIKVDSPPMRTIRRMRSISSISSDLTISDSESSAPPPSLDSRPAPKGRPSNQSNNQSATNGKGKPVVDEPTENEPMEVNLGKETKDSNAPRRSERTVKPIDRDRQSKIGKETVASNARAPLKTKRGGNVNHNANVNANTNVSVDASSPSEEVSSRATIALRSSKRTLRTRA
jgi:hypothetical protein